MRDALTRRDFVAAALASGAALSTLGPGGASLFDLAVDPGEKAEMKSKHADELASAWARQRFGDGAIYAGLLFPIAVCVVTVVVGSIWIRETKGRRLDV